MMKTTREIDLMQFHLTNALYIDGYVIKSGMNIIKRCEKNSKDYVIFHSSNFSEPYTHFPLDHVPALIKFICKRLIDGGVMFVDEDDYEAQEIKPGIMRLVKKISNKLTEIDTSNNSNNNPTNNTPKLKCA